MIEIYLLYFLINKREQYVELWKYNDIAGVPRFCDISIKTCLFPRPIGLLALQIDVQQRRRVSTHEIRTCVLFARLTHSKQSWRILPMTTITHNGDSSSRSSAFLGRVIVWKHYLRRARRLFAHRLFISIWIIHHASASACRAPPEYFSTPTTRNQPRQPWHCAPELFLLYACARARNGRALHPVIVIMVPGWCLSMYSTMYLSMLFCVFVTVWQLQWLVLLLAWATWKHQVPRSTDKEAHNEVFGDVSVLSVSLLIGLKLEIVRSICILVSN